MASLFDIIVARKLSGGGGGGSNTYQIINGTVNSPFGDLNISELVTALKNKQATAYLEADASAIGAGSITARLGTGINDLDASGASINYTSATCYQAAWSSSGTLTKYYISSGGTITDAMPYANLVTTKITVVWHPIDIDDGDNDSSVS